MSPTELRRAQVVHSSVRLLKAAHTAAKMAIADLEQLGGIDSDELKREVAQILGQLQALSSQGPKYRRT